MNTAPKTKTTIPVPPPSFRDALSAALDLVRNLERLAADETLPTFDVAGEVAAAARAVTSKINSTRYKLPDAPRRQAVPATT